MNVTYAVASVMCSAFLLGCSSVSTPPPPTQVAGTTPATQVCMQANTTVQTCEQNASGLLICPVYVFSAPGGAVVFPFTLSVPPGQKARIVWHLLEPKARFEAGDGPLELKTNNEFEDGGPTQDLDGGTISPNGRRYKFVYKNARPGQNHKYSIQFRTQTGIVVKCDPGITNQAG